MTFADASAAIVPAAMPTSAGDMPSTITRRRTSARPRAKRPSDPDLAAASAHDVRKHAVDSDGSEQQRDSCKDSEQQRAEALRRQFLVEHLHHRPDIDDWLLRIDRADRCNGRLGERGGRH